MRRELVVIGSAVTLLYVASCSSGDIEIGTRGRIVEAMDGASRPARNDAGRSDASSEDADGLDDDGSPGEAGLADAGPVDATMDDAEIRADAALPAKRSTGCGSSPPTLDTSIQVNGMTGTYIIDLPEDYDAERPYPLILNLRGAAVTAAMFRSYLNLTREVASDGIVVSPNCLNEENTWNVARDLPYMDALLAKLAGAYCIDESRIFAAGHGPGAQFASVLGCLRGSVFRGIAPLSGTQPVGVTCEGEVAVWISQGNADSLLPLGRTNRDFWVRRNTCSPSSSRPVDPTPCVEYDDCNSGHPVVYCEYEGDLRPPAFAASGVWKFFQRL